ncbi:hypothetical protein RFI_03776 [Reticulomyxa filosa]|uniref:Uncharacterized protein n=1 Tax=Reticulomyxa filosa TaxID=46433 RepID=X6P568_RETFI|nr:hypothetical protein RFI_03776 [Reticulomyxa filosa]|eukprot:ETO33331.1 hypothetical protein RFI_03776 [Reticulomyxa filosa]
MPFKAYVNDKSKVYMIILPELTMEHLQQQILQATQPTHVDDALIAIIGSDGRIIKTDENVIHAFKRDTVFFIAQFQSSFFVYMWHLFILKVILIFNTKKQIENISKADEVVEKKECEKQEILPFCKVNHPLILLTGAIKYEQQQQYLGHVKYDFHLLQTLFQSKFGYQTFNTYNPQDPKTEVLTLNDLNTFILQHCQNLVGDINRNNVAYDGLIFVWCGNGEFGENEDMLITSDNKNKYFKEIQNDFINKTDYFIGKPKIFIKIIYKIPEQTKLIKMNEIIQKTILYNRDTDLFTICTNISKKQTIEDSENSFTEIFCQVMENNINNSLEFILKQVINIVLFDQILKGEIVQTTPITYPEIYLIPNLSKQEIQNRNDEKDSKSEQVIIKKNNISDTLDFKKHWNRNWRKSNAEAAKIVEQMISDNKQGLIIVTYNTSKWKNKNDNFSSIVSLLNNEKEDIKEFGEYIVYVIKRKLIILKKKL